MKKAINDLEYGETGIIVDIRGFRRELNSLGIRTGKTVKMITRQPIKGPVVVIAGDVEVAMGCDLAAGVFVDIREGDR
ncbi:FeoA family protein [Methanofollis tationis]|jgi:ferrous iron transport protein A|uniref:Ferrous iron transport protein A n=2 Tax=Methanofollis TaxID=81416 RepID=A0A7K4HPX6_9EURY|nr:FeoA family protein [Methanofollis tationis]NVO66908.1 ferrous iron transport protein A [Methanofollis tationis]HDS64088.1 ferrous iron transport protein A [Methanofollis liminatans]